MKARALFSPYRAKYLLECFEWIPIYAKRTENAIKWLLHSQLPPTEVSGSHKNKHQINKFSMPKYLMNELSEFYCMQFKFEWFGPRWQITIFFSIINSFLSWTYGQMRSKIFVREFNCDSYKDLCRANEPKEREVNEHSFQNCSILNQNESFLMKTVNEVVVDKWN